MSLANYTEYNHVFFLSPRTPTNAFDAIKGINVFCVRNTSM